MNLVVRHDNGILATFELEYSHEIGIFQFGNEQTRFSMEGVAEIYLQSDEPAPVPVEEPAPEQSASESVEEPAGSSRRTR